MSLTEHEKKLLTLVGEDPSLSRSDLQHLLQYKRVNTVSIKLKMLRRAGYVKGPYYHINLNAVGENRIHNVFAEVQFQPRQYDLVFELVTSINCWEWFFPTIQGNTFFIFFRSNYYAYLTRLLSIVKDAGLIEYQAYSSQNRLFAQNPNFLGRVFPSVDNLFENTTIDLPYPKKEHDTEWRFIDLKVMQYMQVRTCSIGEIQRMERKLFERFWRRNEIKYSFEKIVNSGVAERKHYNISPYPRNECYAFLLLVEGDTQDVVKFMVNFGKACRMYKVFTMCRDVGFLWCLTSPQLGPELMNTLESLSPRIRTRCLQLKSAYHPLKRSFNDEHFDFETQRWTFPFTKYKEQIETIIEKRKE